MTLTEFLLARIAEDEAVARDAQRAEIATVAHEHMARHDPARVLAECEAKRRIVALHHDGRSGDHVAPFCATCSDDMNLEPLPCDTLRALAAVYADHPDYDEEWKP